MTAPRQILRGTRYFVTRRCVQRQFLLRPGEVTNQVFAYLLALGARRFGVRLHAYCVMSNHYHLVLTDPEAQLPAFVQFLDGVMARALNALHDRKDYFWESGSYHAEPIASAEDLIDKAAYTLANPVAAGLVHQARRWPGLWSRPADVGTSRKVQRPAHFFREGAEEDEEVELELAVPKGFASAEAYRAALEAAAKEREAEAAEKRRSFLGAKRVLEQSPFASPAAKEPLRRPVPKVAARDPQLRKELLGQLKTFLEGYWEALTRWREKARPVVFPAGTYLMRVAHGVRCAAAG